MNTFPPLSHAARHQPQAASSSHGNACCGLQGQGKSPAARALAQALADKVSTSRAELDAQHISMILARLSEDRNDDIEHQFTTPLMDRALHLTLSEDTCISIVRALWLLDRQADVPDSVRAKYEMIVAQHRPASSQLEGNVRAALARSFSPAQAEERDTWLAHMRSNVLRWGIEMDLYLPALALDIEIDGPQHRTAQHQKTDRTRDAFLARQGIAVRRIDAEALDFNPQRIARAVRQALDDRVLALAQAS